MTIVTNTRPSINDVNTPKIAIEHYLQVTTADFGKATGHAVKSAAPALQIVVQQAQAANGVGSQESPQAPAE